jgi:hypothetical protein
MLTVDGHPILQREMHHYSLMFCIGKDGLSFPVLYVDGRRVVKRWKLELTADIPEDKYGPNGNTA